MTDESNKVLNLLKLLQINEDYSKVLTLKNLISHLMFKNKLFKENFEKIIPKETTEKKIKFFEFMNKSILCFPNNPNINFDVFLYQIELLDKIKLNCNQTINDILAESMIELLKSNSFKDTYCYCQLIGIQMESFYSANQNAFKNANRLFNSSDFENFRLLIGDEIFSFIIKFCSLFLFDEKLQNYIQILGFSLKEKLNKLFTGQNFSTKFTSSLNLNNFSSKTSTLNNSTFNNNQLPINTNLNGSNNSLPNNNINGNSDENPMNNFANKKIYIPIQNFNVERTKIFYCTNFNRKLGLFKNSIFTNKSKNRDNNYNKNNEKDSNSNPSKFPNCSNNYNLKNKKNNINNINLSVNTMYNRIFEINPRLVPSNIEEKIRNFLDIFNKKLGKYEYYKRLFLCCPTRKDWKEYKKNLKLNLIKIKDPNLSHQEINENQEIISKNFTFLLNSTVEYINVFKFIKDFLDFCLPKSFLGEDNYQVLLDKIKIFITLNRFETFNKINLFDSKEFSFKSMKWLEFIKLSKTTYREIGINLKNFIMKNIIYWIFDYVVVQLIRSHFYVTEKQGDHYKTFYYHKKDWDLILKINEIKFKDQFTEIDKKQAIDILYQKDLAFGKLRLVPKPSTCRPIISYKKRTMRSKFFMKNTLFETQKVFKYLSSLMQYKQNNCVVFDYKAIIQKLRKFRYDLHKKIQNFINEENKYFKTNNEVFKDKINRDIDEDKNNYFHSSQNHRNSQPPNINNKNENKKVYLQTLKRRSDKIDFNEIFNYKKIDNNLVNLSNFKDNKNICSILLNQDSNNQCHDIFDYENSNDDQFRFMNSKKDNNNSVFESDLNNSILNYSTLDIEGCYDNIDIEKMLKIIDTDELISEVFASNILHVILPKPHMLNKKYENNVKFKDCFEMKKLFFVSDNSEYLHFLDLLKGRNDLNYSYCVLYPDYTNMSYLHKKEFIPRIKDIIKNNIIKFNKKFFKQTKGIPQGLSISSFLCNLYFYNIEKYLCREYCKENAFSSKILLRFMDDYLCVSTQKTEVLEFVRKAKGLSQENGFNFNMKKSKNNLQANAIDKNKSNSNMDLIGENYKSVIQNSNKKYNKITNNSNDLNTNEDFADKNNFEDENKKKDLKNENEVANLTSFNKNCEKFNWNGINFEMKRIFNFNMFIDSKENYDLKQYATLININLPSLNNKYEYNWIYKKICSIFLTGHPWIYFISELNSYNVLLANMKDFVQVITFKLIIFTNVLSGSSLHPSQNQFIEILDTCLKKLFFYFNNKMVKAESQPFFISNFELFVHIFYIFMYETFENPKTNKLNNNFIKHSPYLFKCIRRKVLRIRKFNYIKDE